MAFPVLWSEPAHHIALDLVHSGYLLLGQERAVDVVVLFAEVKDLLAAFEALLHLLFARVFGLLLSEAWTQLPKLFLEAAKIGGAHV